MSAVKNKRARQAFIIVIVVFALPVILAKLALHFQWFDSGVTNYGQLFASEKSLTDLALDQEAIKEQWLLLYYPNKNCQQVCQHALTTINSTYVLLGKEIPRVTPIILTDTVFFDNHRDKLTHHKWQNWSLTKEAALELSEGDVVIVDPLGNLVVKHLTPTEDSEIVSMGKKLLADMKKLLKYSRVG
ncbi:hypothetical protein [Thalassotalea hakodatensis]|uniref:hypothetical protein n=1 Tax=Thalassotalea hakodatensis TaxID=3030492 RepID=UPI002572B467|nr:hypothetical protein [Thalassotalea hakodatensis]